MSLRLEMLQVARLAPKLLRDASDLVRDFIQSQLTPRGGFANRAGEPDLYYTVFGIECLLALREEPPAGVIAPFLDSFGAGKELDLVHLACLARCWANLGSERLADERRASILQNLLGFRNSDHGFRGSADPTDRSTIYSTFLAFGAMQDLGTEESDLITTREFIQSLECKAGGYANDTRAPIATTPTTAAALTLLRLMNEPCPTASIDWLKSQALPKGGFRATPSAPIPDLLSTAVALHALSGNDDPAIDALREPCLDFIDSLWTNRGGFHGNWTDDALDCEYTYYGLLALGHLSV